MILGSIFYFLDSKSKRAFTLLELMIVIAITAILAVATMLVIPAFSRGKALDGDKTRLQALLREAQAKSMAQENGQQWGVRFDNASAANGKAVLFSGASYSATSVAETISLSPQVQYGLPLSGTTLDVIFSKITGALATSSAVAVNLTPSGSSNSLVQISKQGLVSLADNAAGYWEFEEGSGSATGDYSGHGNGGALYGSPTWVSGSSAKIGNAALQFHSASSDYVNVPSADILNPSSAVTVEAWVKTTAAGTNLNVAIKASGCATGGYILWLNENGVPGAGKPGFWVGGGPWLDASVAINDGNWHHLAGTFDGTTATIYVDGGSSNSAARSGSLSSSNALQMGGGTYCGSYLDGTIDDVRVFSYARTANQITADYQAGL